jgi:VIT1/CCC1 family predicted Fe2+/Mn2+ transporter
MAADRRGPKTNRLTRAFCARRIRNESAGVATGSALPIPSRAATAQSGRCTLRNCSATIGWNGSIAVERRSNVAARAVSATDNRELHRTGRIGWLRAAVLGANDGIVSTASLVVGVASAAVTRDEVLLAGVAGLVAGALSMAAGEYVSVSSQADTEQAELARERTELATQPEAEEDELTAIYEQRGLEPSLARAVARQLMARDALGAHARDELGLSDVLAARPLQAALASAATFSIGAGVPVATILIAPMSALVAVTCLVSLICLVALGATAARAGGAPMFSAAARVAIWGAVAMALTAGVGALFGTITS